MWRGATCDVITTARKWVISLSTNSHFSWIFSNIVSVFIWWCKLFWISGKAVTHYILTNPGIALLLPLSIQFSLMLVVAFLMLFWTSLVQSTIFWDFWRLLCVVRGIIFFFICLIKDLCWYVVRPWWCLRVQVRFIIFIIISLRRQSLDGWNNTRCFIYRFVFTLE